MGAPHFAKHLEAMNTKQKAPYFDTCLRENCEDYETELYEVDVMAGKCAQSVFSTA